MPARFNGRIAVDVRDSAPDWTPYTPPRAPDGAPNVLIVLYDDTGLAAWEPYGGRIRMPTMQRLADNGLTYDVLPLDDRLPVEILNDDRPQAEEPRDTYVYFPHTAEVPEAASVNIRGRSYRVLAEVDITSPDAEGVIFAHGSRFGGHALFLHEQRLHYVYNFLGIPPEQTFASERLEPGSYVLGMEFTRESAGEHGESHGTTRLYVNDEVVAEGPMRAQIAPFALCGDGLCVGRDSSDAVSSLYRSEAPFKGGTIAQVEVNVGADQYLDLERDAMAAVARE